MPEPDKYAPIPLTIRRDPNGATYLHLGDLDISHLLAYDGLKFEFESNSEIVPAQPTVTLKFAPDGLHVDVEAALVELVRYQDGTLGVALVELVRYQDGTLGVEIV